MSESRAQDSEVHLPSSLHILLHHYLEEHLKVGKPVNHGASMPQYHGKLLASRRVRLIRFQCHHITQKDTTTVADFAIANAITLLHK